jgi:2-keto-4-pentenoate hydratase/2-oxohepta-3-ene-1,7-dioic acid hydratase in catechol pathway
MASMKIARIDHDGAVRHGVVDVAAGTVAPLAPELDLFAALAGEGDPGAPVPLAEVTLLAPLEPASIRDFLTFEEHLEGFVNTHEAGSIPEPWYAIPTFYFTNVAAVRGHGEDVPVPPGCTLFDFECELAAVVGRAGSDLTPEQARGHIAGYTIFNDWSARDLQGYEMQLRLGPAKGKDTANTLGPWVVSADEMDAYRRDDRLHVDMEVFRNGERFGHDTAANMQWSFEQLVAYASRGTQVRPGDVIGSGTCGSGCLAEIWGRRGSMDPPPLAPGDEIELRIEGIGALRSTVVAGAETVDIGAGRAPAFRRERSW